MKARSNQNECLSNFTLMVTHNIGYHFANLSSLMDTIEIETDPTDKLALVELLKIPIAHLNRTFNAFGRMVTMPRTLQSSRQTCTPFK